MGLVGAFLDVEGTGHQSQSVGGELLTAALQVGGAVAGIAEAIVGVVQNHLGRAEASRIGHTGKTAQVGQHGGIHSRHHECLLGALNIADHCREAFRHAKGTDAEFMTAALLHDIGKPYVKAFKDTKGNPSETAHFYSHDNVGAWMVYGVEMTTPYIAWLVGNHMGPFMNSKYYNKLPAYLKDAIDRLHECDIKAH